jgi:hypothetical protein
MVSELLRSLIESPNAAADEVLVEALRLADVTEQLPLVAAILARGRVAGLCGLVDVYDKLPESMQLQILANVKSLHPALRECGRSERPERRLAAMKLIAQGRQGRLSYVLSENLHSGDETLGKCAAGAMTALARWVVRSTRQLQFGEADDIGPLVSQGVAGYEGSDASVYQQLLENRREIEGAVVRAIELHRGSRQQELLHAALLLCDSADSQVMQILTVSRHGGQGVFIRRVQQTPESEHVPAFLLAAGRGGLRTHFGQAFARIEGATSLDALLRRTHWLKDHAMQLCLRQATTGPWLDEASLAADLVRRGPRDLVSVARWVSLSGLSDDEKAQRLGVLMQATAGDSKARLGVMRSAMSIGSASLPTMTEIVRGEDERLARIAARHAVRFGSREQETALLASTADAADSVRRVVSRSAGRTSFEAFWDRYDKLPEDIRRDAGRAMLKLLPDGLQRLARRLSSGDADGRVRAMQIVADLGLVAGLKERFLPLCSHASPRVRSKAVSLLGSIGVKAIDTLLEKAASDPDARVRANAVEVMEQRSNGRFVPVLTEKARHGANRERANAIKALARMRAGVVHGQLSEMLHDTRPEHRVSALWCLRKLGWWKLLRDVADLARADDNIRVKRYAMGVLNAAAVELKQARAGVASLQGVTPAGSTVGFNSALPSKSIASPTRPARGAAAPLDETAAVAQANRASATTEMKRPRTETTIPRAAA